MPLGYSSDPEAPLGTLEHELIEVINRHIRDYQVDPENVADTLTCMAFACLGHLSWFPGNVRAARAIAEQGDQPHEGHMSELPVSAR